MRNIQQKSNNNSSAFDQNNQSNPIIPRKTANRLYGGYNHMQKMYGYQGNVDPLEVFSDFCKVARTKSTVDEVLSYLNLICVNKLGYNFTALGLLNNEANYLRIKLIDHIGNVYSSRILLSETQNPIIDCFLNNQQKNVENINFINIPYLQYSSAMIIPLVNQDKCVGVFIAGTSAVNIQNDEILQILTSYISLLVINKQLSEKVSIDANADSLTGLKNHREFQESLSKEIKNADKNQKQTSIILFDINNISQINREHGHAKGDKLISLVADKVKENNRPGDIAGRYGGDEIGIILPDTSNAEACYVAEYLLHSISCSQVDDLGSVKVNVGVATYPDCATDQEKLVIIAEQAMLISKNKHSQSGIPTIVNAHDIDFWNDMALDSLATVIAKKHSQWGLNFEEEIVNKFHNDSMSNNTHILDIVTSLAGAIDAKDPYTRGHSQSVSRYAEALARTLNLPENEVENIRLAAMLHDVGKIGIPEPILRKTQQLTDQEWEIMKQHPRIGAEKVIKPLHSLRELIPIIEHHHEQWDGKGYPDKLKGEEIPFGARIVSIADAYHAIISDRPYRKGLSVDKAIEILRAGAGINWDKELVRKFLIIAPSLSTMV